MSRATTGLDRAVTLVLGALLVAGGVLALGWYYAWWAWFPDNADTGSALEVIGYGWWPWALGVAAVLLFVLGLRWLVAHAPGRRVSTLRLPGSGSQGRLEVDARSAVAAACGELQRRHDVRSAQGVVRRDRGQLLIDVRAMLEPRSDLGSVAGALDVATAGLARTLERPDLYCRVRLDVADVQRGSPSRVA